MIYYFLRKIKNDKYRCALNNESIMKVSRLRMESCEKTICDNCKFYAPFPLYPRIGTCNNAVSKNYGIPVFSTATVCTDYERYSLNKKDFLEEEYYWCEDCMRSIPGFLYTEHLTHYIRSKLSNTDVEFNVETTHAAD